MSTHRAGTPLKLLIVDDDEGDRKHILRLVKRSDLSCDCTEARTMDEALTISEQVRFDCVIVDYHLPGQSGLDGLETLLRRDAFLPVVVTTGKGSERLASEAIKRGAMEYVCKSDLTADTIQPVLESVIEQAGLNRLVAEQQTALTVFARVLVHDLKAPLQSVLGFAKLIEAFLAKPDLDKEKLLSLANRISAGAFRMNTLIDSLHAYTEADVRPRMERLALGKVLVDVLADLHETIRASGARISYRGLPEVDADPAQLGQLFQNLIANSIKYCKAETPEIRIQAQWQDGGVWRIEVHDNGIGIPKEQSKTIFEPFRRLHSQGEYEGTGLGLATCKKIVGQHGGTIWCQSEAGRGTSFFFTLPAAGNARNAAIASR